MFDTAKEVSHEQAIIISTELKDPTKFTISGLEVISGRHPVHGNIHVVLPAMGGYALLPAQLPVATRIAAL